MADFQKGIGKLRRKTDLEAKISNARECAETSSYSYLLALGRMPRAFIYKLPEEI